MYKLRYGNPKAYAEDDIFNLLTKQLKLALHLPSIAAVEYLYSPKEKGGLNFTAANDLAIIHQTANLMQSLWDTDDLLREISSRLIQLEAENLLGKDNGNINDTLEELWRKSANLRVTGEKPLARLLIAANHHTNTPKKGSRGHKEFSITRNFRNLHSNYSM